MQCILDTQIGYEPIRDQYLPQKDGKLTEMNGLQLRTLGVKVHSSLGIGERLPELLRRIYRKIRNDHPTIMLQYSSRVVVKVMKKTIGENF